MRFMVTGGCGFIGSHLFDKLVSAGHEVLVLDDLSTGRRENLPVGVSLIVDCVGQPMAVRQAMADADGVFHLAAIASVARSSDEWLWSHRVNQGGTVAVLEAARQHLLPVVYASSAAVYGAATVSPIAESLQPSPLTAYGVDKLGSELHASVAAKLHGMSTVGLRFFNVYGPRQAPNSPYSGVISIFANRLRQGLPLQIFGDGRQCRDFVHVDDVVDALSLSMQHLLDDRPVTSDVLNVCTGRATTLLELVSTMGGILNVAPTVTYAAARPGDIVASVGNPAKAEQTIGFRAKIQIQDGLRRLIEQTA